MATITSIDQATKLYTLVWNLPLAQKLILQWRILYRYSHDNCIEPLKRRLEEAQDNVRGNYRPALVELEAGKKREINFEAIKQLEKFAFDTLAAQGWPIAEVREHLLASFFLASIPDEPPPEEGETASQSQNRIQRVSLPGVIHRGNFILKEGKLIQIGGTEQDANEANAVAAAYQQLSPRFQRVLSEYVAYDNDAAKIARGLGIDHQDGPRTVLAMLEQIYAHLCDNHDLSPTLVNKRLREALLIIHAAR